jgi:hypothetical protein
MRRRFVGFALLALAACRSKSQATTADAAAAAPPVAAPPAAESVIAWARGESVVLYDKGETVVARAMESNRTKTLCSSGSGPVLLDPELDLLWIQDKATLKVLDLRAPGGEPITIATDVPEGPSIQIDRELGKEYRHLAQPSVCEADRYLYLDWNQTPRIRLLGIEPEEAERQAQRARIVGQQWLLDQLQRAPIAFIKRIEFESESPSPLPKVPLKCSQSEFCGKAIRFGKEGRMLVLTAYSQGDCHHFDCHMYDPKTKLFATPPAASSWGKLADTPAGPCGLYRFDRSEKRFVIDHFLCEVGGACEDLGGAAMGWLGGGVDLGTNG